MDKRVKKNVLMPFFFFSMAMIIIPIGSYYLSIKYVFDQNNKATYAAIVAVLMANFVLIGYIVLALMEKEEGIERITFKKDQ